MSTIRLTFDNGKVNQPPLTYANNLKLALAKEYATNDIVIEMEGADTQPKLEGLGDFCLTDANAILRYTMNDFDRQDSDEYHYALATIEVYFSLDHISERHAESCTSKCLENYLTSLNEPLSSTRLISFVNALTLHPELVRSSFTMFPRKIQSALLLAGKHTLSTTSSSSKHTGNINYSRDYNVKSFEHPILPRNGERNILITSALPYVNNVPHLGNIIGSVLSADIFARYCKRRNYNTLFICGTDEYGTATETRALEEDTTPEKLCSKYHDLHSDVYKWFQIGFDYFGRTTTERHTEIAQDLFLKLNNGGYLEEQEMKQLYCNEHHSYLADRFVEGTCPKCNYYDARGDQCDNCGSLLDPFQLLNPRCKVDNSTPIEKETNHVFLSLDKLQNVVEDWAQQSSKNGEWSKNAKTITTSWLKEGLNPRCITRDLEWGVPVPLEKFKEKVLYVWFEATIGYSSITANYTKDWEKWWKNPDNVCLYQFMGKDNVPFHTVVYPACQLGSGEAWTMLHHINTTEYLQYESGKFSKSRGVGVFGNNAKETGVSPSVWRYYLTSVRPETSDSHFSWSDLVARNNNELLANLGNFVNRLVKFTNAKYNGVVPDYETKNIPNYGKLLQNINEILRNYVKEMEKAHERRGLEIAMSLSSLGNQFLQENKLDNSLFDEDRGRSDAVVSVGLNIINAIASLIFPFMPESATQIETMLNVPPTKISEQFNLIILPEHNINKADYLFKRIPEEKVKEWRNKYAGRQE